MLSLFFLPFFAIILNILPIWWFTLSMWFLMGLGMAGIGLSVMHDANHGAYSKNARVNKVLGYCLNVVGGFDLNVCRGIDSEFFRRMIVIFNYNVFFMEDITTQYYETSNNRLTMTENCKGFLKHIISQFVNLRKYFKHFLKRPSLLIVRIYIIIMLIFRYIKCFIQHGK